jgi:phytoene synthase
MMSPVRKQTVLHADPADAAAFAAARSICRRSARPFYLAASILRPEKRDAVCALYAICLMLHDAMADETAPAGGRGMREHPAVIGQTSSCCSGGGGESRVNMFRERLDVIYAGALELPLPGSRSEPQHALRAFELTVTRRQIAREHLDDLAESYRLDATRLRYATWSSLQRFCDSRGGAVAVALSEAVGLQHSDAHAQLRQLGTAMTFVELLRNIANDRERGRIYLPLEDLARHRYSERELLAATVNPAWRELMHFEADRARDMLRRGADGICWLADERSRFFAAALTVGYASIVDRIRQNHVDFFHRRVRLTVASQARRLPAAWRLARRSADEPLPLF